MSHISGRLKKIQCLSRNYSTGAKLPCILHTLLVKFEHDPHCLLKRIMEFPSQTDHFILKSFQGLDRLDKGFLVLLHLTSFLLNRIRSNLVPYLHIEENPPVLSHDPPDTKEIHVFVLPLARSEYYNLLSQHKELLLKIGALKLHSFYFP